MITNRKQDRPVVTNKVAKILEKHLFFELSSHRNFAKKSQADPLRGFVLVYSLKIDGI